MNDIEEFGPVSWIRDLFETATAESMYRWVLLVWIVVVVVLVALDRLGTALLGRSRPLVQPPPPRARAWRWGRGTPPPTYSLLPPGSVVPTRHAIAAPSESIPLVAPRALGAGPPPIEPEAGTIISPRPWLSDSEFWSTTVDPLEPLFGYENLTRLEAGLPPERFNPISGRVEVLERDQATGAVRWPCQSDIVAHVVDPRSSELVVPDSPE